MDRPDLDAIEGRLKAARCNGSFEQWLTDDGSQRTTYTCGLPAGHRGECDAGPASIDLSVAAARIRALETERDRLALTLRCERGEWAPEGWTAKIRGDHLRFVRNGSVRPGRTCDVVQHGGDHAIRWHWWDRTIDSDGEATATHGDGYAPTALEAIEAADAAIREVSGG